MHVYPNYYKKFSSLSIRMNVNRINFDDKKIRKSDLYNNNNKKCLI